MVRVGNDSYAGGVTARAKRFSLVNSELRNALNRVVRAISWALLPLMALVVNGQIQAEHGWAAALQDGTWRQAAVAAVASVISLIPQGLVLVTSIAFAVGALKLARSNVLIQELPAVEGLARVDMLCLDKTGTLTDGQIAFDAVHRLDLRTGWEQALAWFGCGPECQCHRAVPAAPFPERSPGRPRPPCPSPPPANGARSVSRGTPLPESGFWAPRIWSWPRRSPPTVPRWSSPRDLPRRAAAPWCWHLAPRPMSGAEAEGRTLPPSLHAVATAHLP